jgi:3-hydroxybutyryl-CoA dehydrogenase
MKILCVGDQTQAEVLKKRIKGNHSVIQVEVLSEIPHAYDVVFDFSNTGEPGSLDNYAELTDKPVFLSNVQFSLAVLVLFNDAFTCKLFGFNGEPSFLDRDLIEVTCLEIEDKPALDKTLSDMGLDYELVDDQVGMVTPRIIAMIINEAYYTVNEGTASREDIDLGMKLGTNYPMGPFEWKNAWGIDRIYELLDALYQDTKDERYKICPLLKKEYLAYLRS